MPPLTLKEGVVYAPMLEATLGKELADQWFAEARLEYATTETNSFEERKGTVAQAVAFNPFDGAAFDLRGSSGALVELGSVYKMTSS